MAMIPVQGGVCVADLVRTDACHVSRAQPIDFTPESKHPPLWPVIVMA